ncbi:ATP-binding protein [Mammaliicoccus sciuri]|uniref:ATP-binding protein n=1 Tax=Mammaliicoccus sciuri TaxID=1296 RepID=UPI001C624A7E|nr:ATP-binding protein [Mammaliicoccus sciuri]QYG30032.1 ATP-binding protein [Mammaliicoccus sciuri]
MSLDIFNPTISVVPKGLEGKTILLYGDNSTGKTKQATRMEKPFVMAFEKGLNAISGVPYASINKWADFRKVNKQLTGKDLERAKEAYSTIIVDTVDAMVPMVSNYVANQHGANDIASGNGGYGLWKQLETEFWEQINLLTGAGFTVVFIGHEERDKDTNRIEPKGGKRDMQIIRDLTDIIVYLKSQGVDEDGNVILSNGYVRATDEYFARSRFDLMPNSIVPFTAENLADAIKIGIEREEEAGNKTVSYSEYVEQNKTEDLNFEEIKEALKAAGAKYHEAGRVDEFIDKLNDTFGEGADVKELRPKQVEAMSVLLQDLRESF